MLYYNLKKNKQNFPQLHTTELVFGGTSTSCESLLGSTGLLFRLFITVVIELVSSETHLLRLLRVERKLHFSLSMMARSRVLSLSLLLLADLVELLSLLT